jgi:polar amino acid transport system substrate-binding protein
MKFLKIMSIVIVLSNSLSASNNIKIMTEVFSPYQFIDKNKQLKGISVEIVQAIKKELNDTSNIKVYPWIRANKILDLKVNTALFSMMKTKSRENRYKWVGPIDKLEMVFFKKKGSPIVINNIEDAKKVNKIGVTKSVANYEILTEKGFTNLDVLQGSDDKNIRKLLKGRIDLWPYVRVAGLYNAKKINKEGMIVAIPNIILASGDLYIAFNKNTDEKIIKKWQNAFDKLKLDGTIDKIKRRY